ncbi:carboxylate-amine ligase, partial [Streptomyces chartreusis]
RVQRLLKSGLIADIGQLYWMIRLSARYPTVEVRCLDVQLRVDDAVMLAGLVRALVTTELEAVSAGTPAPEWHPELLRAGLWHAARHGLNDTLVDLGRSTRPAGDVLFELLRHVTPALDAAGDTQQVTALIHRLLQDGTGADRQRAALAEGGLQAVTDLIAGY